MSDLHEKIVREYLGPLFYYALRKTSNKYDAEDLTQEIFCEILIALDRGTIPNNLAAWIWTIARNRYAQWVKRKQKLSANTSINDMPEITAHEESLDEKLLTTEEHHLLYRELILLSWDYSRIIYAYYFENRSITDIADELSVPVGTIKRKLYESRKQIKEGMNMARIYGKRSFAPENIEFIQNWNPDSGPDGRRLIQRLISQNLLLEAYDNPCTLEEFSLALAIAVPYLEDEIAPLLEYGLLIKEGNRYKTGIVILSKEAQEHLHAISKQTTDALAPLIHAALREIELKNPVLPQSFSDFVPTLLERICARLQPEKTCKIHTIKHSDGSEWAIMGIEKCNIVSTSLEVWTDERQNQVIMLGNRLNTCCLAYNPTTVPCFTSLELQQLTFSSYDKQMQDIMNNYTIKKNRILAAEIPAYLRNTAFYHDIIDFRYLIMERFINDGILTLHKNMNQSSMGVYHIIH